MKKLSGSLRRMRVMNEDVIIRAYCETCGSAITDEDEAYVDSEGRYFDSIECLCQYYDIVKVEF
jgi:hypothetical protein